jgi:hypothetical protein
MHDLVGDVASRARAGRRDRYWIAAEECVLLDGDPTVDLEALSRNVAPILDRTHPLSDNASAVRHLENEHASGRLVIMT